jgi:hypothetical protein
VKHVVLLVLLLAALAAGQHWDLMQVDTADWGAGACAWGTGSDTGFGLIYYNAATGAIRSSVWDSHWHRNDLPIPPVRLGAYGRCFSAARFQTGYAAIAYPVDESYTLGCAVSLNDSWVLDTIDTGGWSPVVGYEQSGAPALLYSVPFGPLVYTARYGSTWVAETLAPGGGTMNDDYGACRLAFDSQGRPYAAVLHGFSFPDRDLYGSYLELWRRDSGAWRSDLIAGGAAYGFGPVSLGIGPQDSACLAYVVHPPYGDTAGLVCDGQRLDTACSSLALAVDRLNRVQVAWVSDSLRFAYRDQSWSYFAVRPAEGMTVHDIFLFTWANPIPFIAFMWPGDGLWLAVGDSVTGIEEGMRDGGGRVSARQTILSGASVVRRLASCVIFDAMGRRVVDPKPGVYFVRGAQAQAQAQALRKVVVTH